MSRGLVSIALLALLALSLAANAYLLDRGLGYYRDLNATRLDPLGLDHFPPTLRPTSDAPTVVFFGDSRAAAWPPPRVEGLHFVNRGISAQTSAQVAARYTAHITPLAPELLILQVGINDLKTIPLFPGSRPAVVANCLANIAGIVDQAHSSGAAVILTTVFPVGPVPLERRPLWSDEVATAVSDVNAALPALVGDDVILLDAFSILAEESGTLRPDYRRDELHLNEAGYQALNGELAPLLATWRGAVAP